MYERADAKYFRQLDQILSDFKQSRIPVWTAAKEVPQINELQTPIIAIQSHGGMPDLSGTSQCMLFIVAKRSSLASTKHLENRILFIRSRSHAASG
jgi:hypothetical protein